MLICEGEKAAMAANRLLGSSELVAITSSGGSKAARKTDWSPLKNRRAIIWPDADPAGLSYASQVGKLLEKAGATKVRALDADALARVLGLSALPKGHDAADIDPESASIPAIRKLIDQAPAASQLTSANRLLDPQDPLATAEQLISDRWMRDGKRTLHRQHDVWWHWNNTHYEEITQARMRAIAYKFCKPATTINPQTGAIEPFKPNSYKISNILDALAARCQTNARAMPSCINNDGNEVPPEQVDLSDPTDMIAFQNGLLSISQWIANPDDPAKALRPHTPAWFSSQVLPFAFDPTAECPIWENFVEQCAQGDESWIAGLAMWFGYNLTTDTSLQRMAMLVGPPRAGKGITARVLRAILGEDNVVAPKISSLSDRFGLWPFIGKLAAIAYDVRIGRSSDAIAIVETILSITGEDPQTIDRKNLAPMTLRLPTRLTFVGNELLNLPDPSGALAARLLVFPFTISHQDVEDETLEQRIMAELPGIANWALIGLRMLRQHGKLLAPHSGQEQKEEFVRLTSPMKGWIEDRVETGEELGPTEANALYDDWKEWCEDQGREPGSKASFGAKLRSAIPLVKRVRLGPRGQQTYRYMGIRLVPKPYNQSSSQGKWGW